ncbi:cholesterol oxidase (plasmid) [Burkholderia ubonensis]|uniref:Cholesterol oxidase n=1 Tax=Burkholderia ubonensis TaxID=101571 RepID=A0A118I013_9BURK|nr:GMC oxidoreductase [Burkholderia ubonensis]AOJ64659.1 cholesterol oxidase [Burkholderia ubonensis]KVG77030.1 cholesterol oxidase [Burkholderia ubonensis]
MAYSRRKFLKSSGSTISALTAAPALSLLPQSAYSASWVENLAYQAIVPELYTPTSKPPVYTKAIVIGSGFGGAISAYRLARAGIQTTVLERGLRWPNSNRRQIFATDALPDWRGYWHRTSFKGLTGVTYTFPYFNGVFDCTSFKNIDVWRGACVGGGSVVFTGVMIQPRQEYFDAIYRGLVNWDEMNKIYYPRVRAMLNLGSMPDDVYSSTPFGHSRIWDQQARKAGFVTSRTDSIFNWNVVRAELANRCRASATIGESNLGNSNGAKFDLNQNYLKYAEATGKATVYPSHEVQRITFDGSRYVVNTIKYAPDGTVKDRYDLTCDYLFLAAGSVGSSQLMVHARGRGDLPNLNEFVGEGWGTNGDTSASRSWNPLKGVLQGSPNASLLHQRGALPTTLESWYTPGMPIDVGIVGSLGMAFDQTNRGRFIYDPISDKVDLHWATSGNDDAIAMARQINNAIAAANGVLPGAWPFAPDVNGSFTAHPLGGLVLGKATDAYGRLVGYKRLYAMDGSVIPGTTGAVNPSLTISALAERNIENIIAADF